MRRVLLMIMGGVLGIAISLIIAFITGLVEAIEMSGINMPIEPWRVLSWGVPSDPAGWRNFYTLAMSFGAIVGMLWAWLSFPGQGQLSPPADASLKRPPARITSITIVFFATIGLSLFIRPFGLLVPVVGILWIRNLWLAVRGPVQDATPGKKSYKRILSKFSLAIILVLAIVASSLLLKPERYATLAWWRGDKFYHGMPASYWIDELKLVCQPVEVQPDAQGMVAIFGGFAVDGLIKIIAEDIKKDAVPYLIEMLQDPNPTARAGAAKALRRIGPDAADATLALIKLLETKQDGWGFNVYWVTLKKINPEAIKALPKLSPRLADTGFLCAWSGGATGQWSGPRDQSISVRRMWFEGTKLVVTNANYDKIKEGMTWNDLRPILYEEMTWDDVCEHAPWKFRADDKISVSYFCDQGPDHLLVELENNKVIRKKWGAPIPFGLEEPSE
jgi:hypothetical protein